MCTWAYTYLLSFAAPRSLFLFDRGAVFAVEEIRFYGIIPARTVMHGRADA